MARMVYWTLWYHNWIRKTLLRCPLCVYSSTSNLWSADKIVVRAWSFSLTYSSPGIGATWASTLGITPRSTKPAATSVCTMFVSNGGILFIDQKMFKSRKMERTYSASDPLFRHSEIEPCLVTILSSAANIWSTITVASRFRAALITTRTT